MLLFLRTAYRNWLIAWRRKSFHKEQAHYLKTNSNWETRDGLELLLRHIRHLPLASVTLGAKRRLGVSTRAITGFELLHALTLFRRLAQQRDSIPKNILTTDIGWSKWDDFLVDDQDREVALDDYYHLLQDNLNELITTLDDLEVNHYDQHQYYWRKVRPLLSDATAVLQGIIELTTLPILTNRNRGGNEP